MAPGARRRRGETAVPSASAKEAGRAPPGGRGAERKRGELSHSFARRRAILRTRDTRDALCVLVEAPSEDEMLRSHPAASVGFYGFYGGRSDFGVRPGSTAQGETTTRGRFRRSRRDRAPPRALDPWRRRSLRGRPSPRRGLPRRQSRAKRSATPRTRGTRPRRGARLWMPISRTTTVGARRAPPSGRPQGRHPRLPGPFPPIHVLLSGPST